jgi:hypothetical protein
MKQEFGKYYLRYAWFPKTLDNDEKVWFKYFYEVHFDLPMVDPVYTISRISTVDYIVECLKGTIVNGRSVDWGFNVTADRMLNATKLLPFTGARK